MCLCVFVNEGVCVWGGGTLASMTSERGEVEEISGRRGRQQRQAERRWCGCFVGSDKRLQGGEKEASCAFA